jgi:hypothetical protein
MPYPERGLRPFGPVSSAPGPFPRGAPARMQYHSPYSENLRGSADRRDSDHHAGDHRHDNDWHHHHYGYYGYYGWAGYPYWPWWGWGYPYLPAYWNWWDDSDWPYDNYADSQYPEYNPAPYDQPAPDEFEPQQPEYTPWPDWLPAPYAGPAPVGPALPDAPVTLVFKDGRPNEQIYNYMLTAKTLSVFDLPRRDIPVNQIDLAATVRLNREAGIQFALPARPN